MLAPSHAPTARAIEKVRRHADKAAAEVAPGLASLLASRSLDEIYKRPQWCGQQPPAGIVEKRT